MTQTQIEVRQAIVRNIEENINLLETIKKSIEKIEKLDSVNAMWLGVQMSQAQRSAKVMEMGTRELLMDMEINPEDKPAVE